MNYADHIRMIEDFPEQGIHFYDIAPLIGNGAVFASVIHDMSEPLRDTVTKIVGFDARGFVFGAAMAHELGVGITMLRKQDKLPGDTIKLEYNREYGNEEVLEIQADALSANDRVVLVDDVIATGGTAVAGIELVRRTGASIVEFTSLIDLTFLDGSRRIRQTGIPVRSLLEYEK